MNTKGYYLEEFNEYLHDLDRAQNTIDCYDLAVKSLVNWYEQSYSEEFKAEEILSMELQSFRSYCLNVLKHRSTTVNNKISAIKEYFNFMCEKRLISVNPAANLKKVKINNQGTVRTTFTVQEFHRLKRAVFKEQNPLHELVLMLLSYTGVRITEAINIRIEDIDLDKKRNGNIRLIGKGFKERTIPIHPELLNSIEKYMEFRSKRGIKSEYLLVSERRDKFTRSGLLKILKKFETGTGLHIYAHKLRSFFIYQILKVNSVNIAQSLAGHSSLLSVQHYTNALEVDRQKAIETLEIP